MGFREGADRVHLHPLFDVDFYNYVSKYIETFLFFPAFLRLPRNTHIRSLLYSLSKRFHSIEFLGAMNIRPQHETPPESLLGALPGTPAQPCQAQF